MAGPSLPIIETEPNAAGFQGIVGTEGGCGGGGNGLEAEEGCPPPPRHPKKEMTLWMPSGAPCQVLATTVVPRHVEQEEGATAGPAWGTTADCWLMRSRQAGGR